MKILHITTHLNIGGVAKYVSVLSSYLRKRGHDVIVASAGGDLEAGLLNNGIKVIDVDIKTKSELNLKLIKAFFSLHALLKKEKVDIIHAHTRVAQVIAALLSKKNNVPYVTTCHGFFKDRLGRRVFPMWGRRVVAISEAVKDDLITRFKVAEERIALIYTGIELNRFEACVPAGNSGTLRSRLNLGNSGLVGTIGRLSYVKGQDTLLRAFKDVAEDLPDVKLILVGDGPEEKRLKELSRELGIEKKVAFIASVEDTREALSLMDVFVLPSIEEGLGLSLIEAMASEVPCVASRIGGIENLIEDGVNGILVKTGDHRAFADAIKSLLTDKPRARAFKAAAKKKVMDNYDINMMVTKMEDMYRRVLSAEK